MTTSPVKRVTRGTLDGTFCADRGKRLVVSFIPGDGDKIPDLLELRPLRTRRAERIAVIDAYRYALRCRINRDLLERARNRKAAKQARRERLAIKRAEARLFEKGS